MAAFVLFAAGCQIPLPRAREHEPPVAATTKPKSSPKVQPSTAKRAPDAAAESSASATAGRASTRGAAAAGSGAATLDAGVRASAGSPAQAPQVELVPPNGEVCDGKDNDDNNRIDDADVEGDGVCDCLKIASIGRPGAFGQGDLQFRTWPNAMAQHHVVPLNDAKLTYELLAEYDVLIVLNVSTVPSIEGEATHHVFSDNEIAAFERWVRAGGGAFTTAGYSGEIAAEVANVNKLLAPFELAYSPTKYGLNGIITNWTEHPVTEGVERVYTEVGAEPDGPAALTLGIDPTAHVALQAPKDDPAKILVWGDEWITYASQWQAEADQQVERFWVNALTWLSREDSCQHKL